MSETGSDPGVGKPRLSGVPLLIVALSVVLAVQAAFVLSYVGALHHPKPHGVRVGVVGASPLPAAVGTRFSLDLRRYSTEAAARAAIDRRKIDGAFVAGPAGATLIVAPAASPAGASALAAVFGAAAAAAGQKLAVVQVHVLPAGDAGGSVSFLVVMALIIGGYLSSTIAMAFGGPATRRGRLVGLGIAAVVGALLTDTFAGPVLSALPTSKFLELWGIFTLVMMAVAFATAALQTVLGAAGTLVVVVVFVIFGAPASGGTVPSPYLPGFWRTFGPYLPAGAGTTAVRNTVYFGGNAIATSLLVLAGYLVAGAAAVLVLRGRRAASEAEAEAEASAAAAAPRGGVAAQTRSSCACWTASSRSSSAIRSARASSSDWIRSSSCRRSLSASHASRTRFSCSWRRRLSARSRVARVFSRFSSSAVRSSVAAWVLSCTADSRASRNRTRDSRSKRRASSRRIASSRSSSDATRSSSSVISPSASPDEGP